MKIIKLHVLIATENRLKERSELLSILIIQLDIYEQGNINCQKS